jgi:hypothetical protein
MRPQSTLLITILTLCVGVLLPSVGFATEATQTAWSPEDKTEGLCTATAFCWDGSTRSCSGYGTCKSFDSYCPSPGYAECGETRVYCPPCPSCPREGAFCWDNSDCQPPDPGCVQCVCAIEMAERPGPICLCP